MNKILLIDKPVGWTSFDVVAKLRSAIRIKNKELGITTKVSVGHAGTLDPFATGLLIVLVGAETKNQDKYMKQDKEYEATLRLGFTSTTGDPEGEITPFLPLSSLVANPGISSGPVGGDPRIRKDDKIGGEMTKEIAASRAPRNDEVEKVLEQFLGEIEQIPPIYSAIKVDGKRAYKLAREGKVPEMKSRQVRIDELRIKNYEYPKLEIVVRCSSGTYIRTLAEDIGKALGCGAYLTDLRRTKIGEYQIEDTITIEEALAEVSEA